MARTSGDRPRLLARRSEHGYTDRPALALPLEPEAIDEETQRRQTLSARRREQARLRAAFDETSAKINGSLDELSSRVALPPGARSGVRAVRRSTAALGRRLDLD
jgi:hypothetical protein